MLVKLPTMTLRTIKRNNFPLKTDVQLKLKRTITRKHSSVKPSGIQISKRPGSTMFRSGDVKEKDVSSPMDHDDSTAAGSSQKRQASSKGPSFSEKLRLLVRNVDLVRNLQHSP